MRWDVENDVLLRNPKNTLCFSTFALGSGDPNLNEARLRAIKKVEIDNVDIGLRKGTLLHQPI